MRRKRRPALPKGIDSKFEADLKNKLVNVEWKPPPVEYQVPHRYNPDALFGNTLIEMKGRFRTSDEARKYIWIREHLEEGEELVFVFYNPDTRMPRARRRKDGTYNTHREWAEKNGFTYYTSDTVPEEWHD